MFRGVVSFDNAGGHTAQILYPAPNAAIAFAALLTHGLINAGARAREKTKMQEKADEVLKPYENVLNGFKYEELIQLVQVKSAVSGTKQLVGLLEKPGSDWFVVTNPIFSLTQDESAIVLDDAILIYAPDSPAAPVYQNGMRIISTPQSAQELLGY